MGQIGYNGQLVITDKSLNQHDCAFIRADLYKQAIHIYCHIYDCLLELDVLGTSEFISGQVPTYSSTHSWQLYSTSPLGDQAVSSKT